MCVSLSTFNKIDYQIEEVPSFNSSCGFERLLPFICDGVAILQFPADISRSIRRVEFPDNTVDPLPRVAGAVQVFDPATERYNRYAKPPKGVAGTRHRPKSLSGPSNSQNYGGHGFSYQPSNGGIHSSHTSRYTSSNGRHGSSASSTTPPERGREISPSRSILKFGNSQPLRRESSSHISIREKSSPLMRLSNFDNSEAQLRRSQTSPRLNLRNLDSRDKQQTSSPGLRTTESLEQGSINAQQGIPDRRSNTKKTLNRITDTTEQLSPCNTLRGGPNSEEPALPSQPQHQGALNREMNEDGSFISQLPHLNKPRTHLRTSSPEDRCRKRARYSSASAIQPPLADFYSSAQRHRDIFSSQSSQVRLPIRIPARNIEAQHPAAGDSNSPYYPPLTDGKMDY